MPPLCQHQCLLQLQYTWHLPNRPQPGPLRHWPLALHVELPQQQQAPLLPSLFWPSTLGKMSPTATRPPWSLLTTLERMWLGMADAVSSRLPTSLALTSRSFLWPWMVLTSAMSLSGG